MSVTWTKEQQQVIRLRERNLLVSAAAGSGKTAVLVERILHMISDPENPLDIDRLLVMTFTRAAAGEMKMRLTQALEEALEEQPENDHLQKQMNLVHSAQITTIDGFCSYVIRNYFHTIGLEPGWRTADEGELKLLKSDVVRELLEEEYAQKRPEFLEFAESYAPGKQDEELEKWILKLYEFSMSNPWPREWLQECVSTYQAETYEELMQASWMEPMWEDVQQNLKEARRITGQALALTREADGPYMYEEALASDLQAVEQIEEAQKDYRQIQRLLEGLSFARLSAKKDANVSQTAKEQVKNLRQQVKDIVKGLKEQYFACTAEELLEILALCRTPVEELVRLTLKFAEDFAEKKREKNILDFSDMEHFALDILVKRVDGRCEPTDAARELSLKYEEILVDEYQDSNYVQELLMTQVSGWAKEKNNIFMVGDIKQSIYRFRLARPELFAEKLKTYRQEESEKQRIDLHRNFRSRREVLSSVNYIFRQIMGEDLGQVEYDDAAALYPGAAYPEGNDPSFQKTEVLLIERDSEVIQEEEKGQTAQELEALAIAQRIKKIVGKELVWDKKLEQYRPAGYGDIVILLRTVSGWAETMNQVLQGQGIPAYTVSKTGYFSALEVVTVLNYLHICDNPLQDIPMAGILHSPIGNLTAQEMAEVKNAYPNRCLYEAACAYAGVCLPSLRQEEGEMEGQLVWDEGILKGHDPRLEEKLKNFLRQLEEFRQMVPYTPIHELILAILQKTGYGYYAAALPAGEQRQANLHMLVEKALDYEETSYRGLFNFIRYIEHLQQYQVDFGEVNIGGSTENSVEIMSIHKSKGLEFPIVFAAGMGKTFNFQDLNTSLVFHPDYGVGADGISSKRRIRVPFLQKQVLRRQLQKESLGEELRILYVALTRAKEKLILTGTITRLEKMAETLQQTAGFPYERLPYQTRVKARTYWDWILPALSRHRGMDGFFDKYERDTRPAKSFYEDEAEFQVVTLTPEDLIEEEMSRQVKQQLEKETLLGWEKDKVYDEGIRKILKARFEYQYPYAQLGEIPAKISVSELKRKEQEQEEAEELYSRPEVIPLIPAFIREKEEEYTGALKGTVYHKVLEHLDYEKIESREQIQSQIDQMLLEKQLDRQAWESIRTEDFLEFAESRLGQRMKEAAGEKRLHREQPFVIQEKAQAMNPQWEEGELLVQGIIDAYFTEGEELVLVDYKTDRVPRGAEEMLKKKYQIQLAYYARALTRLTGKKVKEQWIYSFSLKKAVLIERSSI